MFRETVTSADGSTSEGSCSEAQASRLLRRVVRLGYRVEATRSGGAVIVRTIPHGGDTWKPARQHTVMLEPVTVAGKITATVRGDLGIVGRWAAGSLAAQFRPETGRIDAGLNSIPPGAAARLIERGLVTVDGTSVAVSLVARLAMLAQDHRTETREPRGYVRPAELGWEGHAGLNKPGGRSGKMYDRSSVASCSCRGWSYPAEDREDARRRAHGHRQEVTAAMIRDLGD
jgi:hypothetical protein